MLIKYIIQVGLYLLVALTLSACVLSDTSDLEVKIAEYRAQPAGVIEPLPIIKPYEAYIYKSGKADARDPFWPFFQKKIADLAAEIQPVEQELSSEFRREIIDRKREDLENYELDSLKMVGTVEDEKEIWAIVLDPNGVVHRVKTGNYIGRNIGKITNIFEEQIKLREIIKDSSGRWEEREAALALLGEG